ncbi:phage portal protein [Mesorhizobium sp. BR-1-1-8]|uniref:phage portal protein n=1 Tax=Mesorhizobium sp. BR-1-1-8 TaxID=2876659 RepID=UPI001CCF24C8|nr:phage portal protein [Mesorhizobium sp. BR-1-1-8]MBZ9980409.1 phage portal protein [Mesorhizobium sp. BR-1-1-8]
MNIFGLGKRKEVRSASSPENPTVPVSAENFLAFFGVQSGSLPAVTIDSALGVPAVAAAVTFLSGSMANLPLHVFRAKEDGAERIKGGVQRLLNEAPNPEWTSFGWRRYFWQQVFTGGRGVSWIERSGTNIIAIWPMDPACTTVKRVGGKKVYSFDGRMDYPASDVIDVPFMLKRDQLSVYSPIMTGSKAIALALAMGDYAGNFFAGGGVPPLALSGPLPQGGEAMQRAMGDVHRAIDAAKKSDKPIFPMPPGHELKPVGFDPAKGQMTEARLFQISEIARIYNLPPVFLQDLTHGNLSNVEQQDLHLVKHLISQWAKAFEEELNLKLFGQRNSGRYAEHALDALMRGDFKSRIEGLARGVQSAILTPDEARALENRPAKPNGDKLYIQGATVPLGSQPVMPAPANDNAPDKEANAA